MSKTYVARKMFRLLQSGPLLVADLPYIKEDPQRFAKETGFDPESMQFEISGDADIVASGSIGPDYKIQGDMGESPDGSYEVRILANHSGERKECWKQLVFIQSGHRRSPEQIHEIAERFAPIFVFSSSEDYFPVSLGELVSAPELLASNQTISVATIFGKEEIPLRNLSEFLRYNGHADYLLDQSVFDLLTSDIKKIQGAASNVMVYYSYFEDRKSDRFFINYHTYYAFDPKSGIAKFLNVGPHIFDRESMTISFGPDEQPDEIVISGHMENQTIKYFDGQAAWDTGRVSYPFAHPNAPILDGHTVVAVAEGSHALYPAAGHYHIMALKETAGHILHRILPQYFSSEGPEELMGKQALLPPPLSSKLWSSYVLRPLRLDRLKSEADPEEPLYDPDTSVLSFSGYWVDVPGFENERFPPFSRREIEIESWVDDAYKWSWDKLPDDVRQHALALVAEIHKQI